MTSSVVLPLGRSPTLSAYARVADVRGRPAWASSWLLVPIAVVLCADAAQAQAAVEPRLATHEEYRACRVARAALEARAREFENLISRQHAGAAQLQRQAEAYMVGWKRRGTKTAQDVATYNEGVERFNARTKASNAEASTLQRQQDAYNAEVLEINVCCGGQSVAKDVADEVDRELQQGTQVHE